jgi:cob(I)alamin adenosyltransferase
MSITTKTGDGGMTGLMYNRRVPKSHPQVEAYGAVDELNAALGLARVAAGASSAAGRLLDIQKHLVGLMGELATAPEDRTRYQRDGFEVIAPAQTEKLDQEIRALEASGIGFVSGWVMPGDSLRSATLDAARTACRRAERRVSALRDSDEGQNPEILVYLNRLSDLLWLMAREADRGEPG